MDAIINILHSETTCALSRLIKRLIQLETKLQYDVLSHEEYEEELHDVYFLKKDQNFTPEQFTAIDRAFQKIMAIAATKFLDMENR
jgi:uncharacterized protein YfkK (UPF0435 family)